MKNVLIIEPRKTLAHTYGQALEQNGCKVRIVSNAHQALECAEDLLPDVIVLELQLVGYDGIEFLHEFRSYGDWKAIPVIINTHLSLEVTHGLGKVLVDDFGVEAVLYKPDTTLQKLRRVVSEHLEAR